MRIEGRSPQFVQSQSNTSIAQAAQSSKTQEAGQVGTAQPGVALPQDQYGSARANSQQDYKYNPSGTALQVPDALRRGDRTVGDPHVSESRGNLDGLKSTSGAELDGLHAALDEKVTVGQKVRTGEKLGPPPGQAGDMHEAKMGGKLEPKPGFEGSPDKPTVGQKLGPGPGQPDEMTMPKATMGQKLGPKPGDPAPDRPVVGEKLGPNPSQAGEEAGSWSWGKGESVPKPFADGQSGGEVAPTLGEKLGIGPDVLQGASYATPPGSKDTEINVPKPEPKPDNSPWGKPVPEPKHPDMWKD